MNLTNQKKTLNENDLLSKQFKDEEEEKSVMGIRGQGIRQESYKTQKLAKGL